MSNVVVSQICKYLSKLDEYMDKCNDIMDKIQNNWKECGLGSTLIQFVLERENKSNVIIKNKQTKKKKQLKRSDVVSNSNNNSNARC